MSQADMTKGVQGVRLGVRAAGSEVVEQALASARVLVDVDKRRRGFIV